MGIWGFLNVVEEVVLFPLGNALLFQENRIWDEIG